ncbi:hypothetical protein Bhyg_14536 [Pseudolycoriella hygida]|uniref:Uncharacterized protein n=1 Tax=Pseudolycoriella hygida TaxID=35572 RepID=A0A9Q0RVQ9_9DIPT|nr:hypothetical protein Bhyg_14536 [Pseudolycoriella hygida]
MVPKILKNLLSNLYNVLLVLIVQTFMVEKAERVPMMSTIHISEVPRPEPLQPQPLPVNIESDDDITIVEEEIPVINLCSPDVGRESSSCQKVGPTATNKSDSSRASGPEAEDIEESVEQLIQRATGLSVQTFTAEKAERVLMMSRPEPLQPQPLPVNITESDDDVILVEEEIPVINLCSPDVGRESSSCQKVGPTATNKSDSSRASGPEFTASLGTLLAIIEFPSTINKMNIEWNIFILLRKGRWKDIFCPEE